MDDDLERMTRRELLAEVQRLRQGIREHRDSTEHDLCCTTRSCGGCYLSRRTLCRPFPRGRNSEEFLRGCIRYRQSLEEQAPDAPRTDERYGR